jgi:hypothetical protein
MIKYGYHRQHFTDIIGFCHMTVVTVAPGIILATISHSLPLIVYILIGAYSGPNMSHWHTYIGIRIQYCLARVVYIYSPPSTLMGSRLNSKSVFHHIVSPALANYPDTYVVATVNFITLALF